jgi:hypothetical protein
VRSRTLVPLLAVLAALGVSEAHVLLDGETVRPLLLDIARYRKDAQDGPSEAARLEALYSLGDKVLALCDLMNLDATAHGTSLYAELLVRRLHEHGIQIGRAERRQRYVYDMAAFHEYLRRSPRGPRAADAGFRLIAQAFHGSVGGDPADLVDSDVEQLRRAIGREEAFLTQHPRSERRKEVRFFLAMDYYRLSRHSRDPVTAAKYEKRAGRALREIVEEYPGTAEARAAEAAVEALAAQPRR